MIVRILRFRILLAILCLSVLPQALLYSCYFCVSIFPRNIGNQDDITSFAIMRNLLFSFRLNGRKSNFCGESSYVSLLVVLLAILCLSVLPQALLYSFFCCVLMFRVCGNQHNKFIANIKKKVGREISGN